VFNSKRQLWLPEIINVFQKVQGFLFFKAATTILNLFALMLFQMNSKSAVADTNIVYIVATGLSIFLTAEGNRIARLNKHRLIINKIVVKKYFKLAYLVIIASFFLLLWGADWSNVFFASFFAFGVFSSRLIIVQSKKVVWRCTFVIIALTIIQFKFLSDPLNILLSPGANIGAVGAGFFFLNASKGVFTQPFKLKMAPNSGSFYLYEGMVALSFIVELIYFEIFGLNTISIDFIIIQRLSGYYIAIFSIIYATKHYMFITEKLDDRRIKIKSLIFIIASSLLFFVLGHFFTSSKTDILLGFTFLVLFQLAFGLYNASFISSKLSKSNNTKMSLYVLAGVLTSFTVLFLSSSIFYALICKSLILTLAIRHQHNHLEKNSART